MVWALGTNATSKAVQINAAKDKVKTVAEAPVEMEAADVRGFKGVLGTTRSKWCGEGWTEGMIMYYGKDNSTKISALSFKWISLTVSRNLILLT